MDYLCTTILIASVICIQKGIIHAGRTDCTFPEKWRGRWHRNMQNTIGEVQIRKAEIEGLGECIASKPKDMYLMYDRDARCHKCLLMVERDDNLIQYKESFCYREGDGPPDIDKICATSNIMGQPMYILVKVTAHLNPTECPFGRSRHFSYQNNTDALCDSPRSEVFSCASSTKMHMTFGACDTSPGARDIEFQAECLADWKTGSDRHVYISILNQNSVDGTPVYRCFKYEKYGSQIRALMSLDTSCRTSISLTLYEEESFDSGCSFPSWTQHNGGAWMLISGTGLYQIRAEGNELYANKHKDHFDAGRTTQRFTCLKKFQGNSTEAIMAVKSVHKCTASYQCLKLHKTTSGVLQLTEGSRSKVIPDDCVNALSQKKHIHSVSVFIKDTQDEDCPMKGVYTTVEASGSPGTCHVNSVHIGCKMPSIFTTYENHGNKFQNEYRCLKHWTQGAYTHVIARTVKNNEFICMVYGDTGLVDSPLITMNNNCVSNSGNMCVVSESRSTCQESDGRYVLNSNIQEHQTIPENGISSANSIISHMALTLLYVFIKTLSQFFSQIRHR